TVSPQLQKIIGAPLSPVWNVIPPTNDEWKKQIKGIEDALVKTLPGLREQLGVNVEPTTFDGVKAYIVAPETIPPENRNRWLVNVHGAANATSAAKSGTPEAIYMAGFGKFKIISADYRTPPDHPNPPAPDDAMTVWKAAVKMADPKDMAIFGSSAGGALTLSMVLGAKRDGLPLPAAIAPGTPMSDLTGSGDTFQTNAMVDNVLVAYGAN